MSIYRAGRRAGSALEHPAPHRCGPYLPAMWPIAMCRMFSRWLRGAGKR